MSASFSIVIEGKGTFTASIADPEASVTVGTNTPASFTAEVAPVGPAGATGATGPSGVVYATSPLAYNSGTQTVSIDLSAYATQSFVTSQGYLTAPYNPFNQTLDTSSTVQFAGVSISGLTGYAVGISSASVYAINTTSGQKGAYLNGDGLNLLGSGAGIIFANSTTQTTAFPPAGGTVSQYIDGTGALETFPAVGDRYLTSSTSTLTCDNANGKTMTVGTGLAYTAQQDITVLYDNSNHMHGTVTSYNSGTGVLVFDSNKHSGGPGPFSNWVVNVGGVAGAILPVGGTAGQVLSKINSTNYNTEWVSLAYAPIASPTFTGDPQAPTPTAGDNDTSIATTAFVNTYCPSASTTTAGKVELATEAEAIAGTSTTLAVTPAGIDKFYQPGWFVPDMSGSTAVTSTGQTFVSPTGINTRLTATASGQYAIRYFGTGNLTVLGFSIGSSAAVSSFSRRLKVTATCFQTSFTSAATARIKFGISGNPTAPGDLSTKGVGIRIVGTGAVELQVHNGTTLTNVTSSFTPTSSTAFRFLIDSDGSSNVTLYVDSGSGWSSVATSTAGPTGSSSNYPLCSQEIESTATFSGTAMGFTTQQLAWYLA